MANTDHIFSLLPAMTAVSITKPATVWGFSNWVALAGSLAREISVFGLIYHLAYTGEDINVEILFEIGTGAPGSEVTKVQIPVTARNDTGVGFFMPAQNIFLPEPVVIPANTRLSVRVADGGISSKVFTSVKLRYQSTADVSAPNQMPNNYQFVRVGNGMSTGERIR